MEGRRTSQASSYATVPRRHSFFSAVSDGPSDAANNSVSAGSPPQKVRKVSRACDFCKSRKARCNGSQPCSKCTAKGQPCLYNAKYTRGRPPTPPPPPPVAGSTAHRSYQQNMGSLRASPELGVAEIQGQVFDPTSGLTFLHRAWKRLSAENTHSMSDVVKTSVENQPLAMAGDRPMPEGEGDGAEPCRLPSPAENRMLLTLYFDFCIATYRFLYRPAVEKWLAVVERNVDEEMPVWNDIGRARAAIVHAVLAMAMAHRIRSESLSSAADENLALRRSDELFRMSTRLTDAEVGYPKLESVQARLVQVLYLLTTSRFNRSWYVFGNALQIISTMGLHRRESSKRRRVSNMDRTDYIQAQCRMRTFWTAYIMDNHLGVIFGRPRHFHDDDLDQDFPDRINDENMTPTGPSDSAPDKPEDCHMDALISHAKIAQIIGSISREVYTIKDISEQERAAAAERLLQRIREWYSSLPLHLGSIPPSMLISSYRRQATVLKLGHDHAIMHVNRLFILDSSPRASTRVQDCISAAVSVLQTVDHMASEGPIFRSFWWTHYVTFCALVVVYVWAIQQRRLGRPVDQNFSAKTNGRVKLLELAVRCQGHLAFATATNSPIRRYAVILEEFQATATGQQPTAPDSEQLADGHDGSQSERPADAKGGSMAADDVAQVSVTGADNAALLDPHLLGEWQTTDWLDIDSSLFWPNMDFDESTGSANGYTEPV